MRDLMIKFGLYDEAEKLLGTDAQMVKEEVEDVSR
jgi:hypothetical protein